MINTTKGLGIKLAVILSVLVGVVAVTSKWSTASTSSAKTLTVSLENKTWHFWKTKESQPGATLDTFDIDDDYWIDLTFQSSTGLATLCVQRDSASIAIETFEYCISGNTVDLIHPIIGFWGEFTWDVSYNASLGRDVATLIRINPNPTVSYFPAVIGAVKELDVNGVVVQSFDELAKTTSELLEIQAFEK